MTEKHLRVHVVAKRLQLCPETIRRYIRRGLLKATRLPGSGRGGNYLIPESSLTLFLTTYCDSADQSHS